MSVSQMLDESYNLGYQKAGYTPTNNIPHHVPGARGVLKDGTQVVTVAVMDIPEAAWRAIKGVLYQDHWRAVGLRNAEGDLFRNYAWPGSRWDVGGAVSYGTHHRHKNYTVQIPAEFLVLENEFGPVSP